MTPLRAAELFAGCGGLALGSEDAGLSHAALVEWDADCCATLRANRPAWPVVGPGGEGDVRLIYDEFKRWKGGLDVVTGGPPCQPFSTAGKRELDEDPRDMWPHAIRCVDQARPRAFLFENVKGMLKGAARGYYEDEVLAPLRRLGYEVEYRVLNAADYGTPQARERVFTIGFKEGLGARWEWPLATHSEGALLFAQWVDGSYWKEHGLPRPDTPTALVERVERLQEPALARWRTVRDVVTPGAPDPAFELRRDIGIVETHDPDAPARTVTASHWNNKLLKLDGGLRYLTVREMARLQEFPPEWRFAGRNDDARLKQIGNAVPVTLARAVMAAVARALNARLDESEARDAV